MNRLCYCSNNPVRCVDNDGKNEFNAYYAGIAYDDVDYYEFDCEDYDNLVRGEFTPNGKLYKNTIVGVLDDKCNDISADEKIYVVFSWGTQNSRGYVLRKYIDTSKTKNLLEPIFYGEEIISNHNHPERSSIYVWRLQQSLNRFAETNHGGLINVDGCWNSETKDMLVAFQKYSGIAADGALGDETKATLVNYINELNAGLNLH